MDDTPLKVIKYWLYSVLYITSLYLTYFISSSLYLLIPCVFLLPVSFSLLITTGLFSVSESLLLHFIPSFYFIDSAYKGKCTVSAFVCLNYFAKYNTLQPNRGVAHGNISLLYMAE